MTARDDIERVLRENGISETAPSDLHSWRCEYPDMHPHPCRCFTELVDDLMKHINGRTSDE